MTEQDIINLIKSDPWMMDVLHKAEKLNLKDWVIGAGFVRNKVWDHLHGYTDNNRGTDIDLVYFDTEENDEEADIKLSTRLKEETGFDWEVVNQTYIHTSTNVLPYSSTEVALSRWPETVTGVGVRLKDGELTLVAPHGIDDLIHMIIRPTPAFVGNEEYVKNRVEKKKWMEKWPKLRFAVTEK